MKIKSTHPESQGDYVEINDEDFNPEIHQKYDVMPDEEKEIKPRRGKKNVAS